MARPWSRKGKQDGPDAARHPRGDADLNAVEHAWWAQRDVADLLAQSSHPEPQDHAKREDQPGLKGEPERDILAEHFGADWRTSFGFDHTDDVRQYEPPPQDEPGRDTLAEQYGADWRTSFGSDDTDARPPDPQPAQEEPAEDITDIAEIDTSDPYAVLEVDPSASWEDIVAAHRRQARRHHPDRLGGQPEAVIAAAEDRIRHINGAYQELRVRRAK